MTVQYFLSKPGRVVQPTVSAIEAYETLTNMSFLIGVNGLS